MLQVLIGAPCSNKVDMYSFGVIMWELVTGEQPRRGMLREIKYASLYLNQKRLSACFLPALAEMLYMTQPPLPIEDDVHFVLWSLVIHNLY